jgi:hypothetical protein
MHAFDDSWHWTEETARALDELKQSPHFEIAALIDQFQKVLGNRNDVTAYLVMMAPRLIELRRVLKPTGSLYLHCDPTVSHYLKMLLDAVFGPHHFVNELVWKRTSAHSDAKQGAKHFGRLQDVILLYGKSPDLTWHPQHTPHDDEYVRVHYPHVEEGTGRRYGLWDMTGPGGAAKGNPHYGILGITRYWHYSEARMKEKIEQGRVVQPRAGAVPRERRYLDESGGVPIGTLWTDVPPVNSQAAERLGYATQKPEALLERIITASSNEGDVVLDPFCGCGTAVAVAHRLKRRWIGIDITYLAINLIEYRLKGHDLVKGEDYLVIGEPKDAASALALAQQDKWQFQFWATAFVGAFPVGGEKKKGSDKGIDGLIPFVDGASKQIKRIIVQVKGGEHVGSPTVRDLAGVVEREKAAMGFLICVAKPTKDMQEEAAHAGRFTSESWGSFPKLQIRTVEQLFSAQGFEHPRAATVGMKAAPKAKADEQLTL